MIGIGRMMVESLLGRCVDYAVQSMYPCVEVWRPGVSRGVPSGVTEL